MKVVLRNLCIEGLITISQIVMCSRSVMSLDGSPPLLKSVPCLSTWVYAGFFVVIYSLRTYKTPQFELPRDGWHAIVYSLLQGGATMRGSSVVFSSGLVVSSLCQWLSRLQGAHDHLYSLRMPSQQTSGC